MKYDVFAEQATLANIEYCESEINRINAQISELMSEREEREENLDVLQAEATRQRLAHEAEENARFEAEQ